MRNLFIWILLFALPAAAAEPAAIVYSLAGGASLTAPVPRPLRLFDRLPAGTAVEVSPGSRVALAFASGLRYELGERARVTIGTKDLASRTGIVRALPRVPPLPSLSPIALEDRPGLKAGAVRIRAERVTGLYPRRGAAALAGETVLRFHPVAAARAYRIEVQDGQGRVAFSTEIADPAVRLPRGTLKAGLRYRWKVSTVERAGPVARGEAEFFTLPRQAAGAREALRKAVQAEGDGASLALLAEIDRSLGLLAEAREELRAALQASPADVELAAALADLEQDLGEKPGVVIEEVTPESLGARAGLQAGDLLLSWCRMVHGTCVSQGSFKSPFDFEEVDLEESPRGGVRILGKRGRESTGWALLPGSQSAKVRPVLADELETLYEQGRSLAAADLDAAVERWRSAALRAGEDRLGVWLLLRAAGALAEARQGPRADALYQEAAGQAGLLGEPKLEALVARTWGRTLQKRGSWEEAESQLRRALAIDWSLEEEGLAAALDLHILGTTAAQRSELREAEALLLQALAIRERLAPRSNTLAATLMNLGNVIYLQGDLSSAEGHMRRALSIQQELAPGSVEVAGTLLNLGNVVILRGNLAGAEEHYRRAKAIYESVKPVSLEMAKALKNLSDITSFRDDRETSGYLLQRALEIEEKLDPSGAALAVTLENLGLQALARGDVDEAERHLRRAVSLQERLEPEGLVVARGLNSLASIALQRKDCEAAEALLQRASAIHRKKLNPGSVQAAVVADSLGRWDLECGGDLSNAEDHFRRSLAIRERVAPGTGDLPLHSLGRIYREQGRLLPAAEAFCKAADISENQRGWIGLARYRESSFTDCLAARVELGEWAEAFHVLERGRARAFLDQLAERDLLFSKDLPEELARRKRELDKQLDSTQAALTRSGPIHDAAEVERLVNRLREIQDRQQELTAEIRKSSPHLASLQYPEPLDLAGARQALDSGTALLSYSVGEEKSYLFLVHPPEIPEPALSVFPLAIGEDALREAVASFNRLLQDAGSDSAELNARGRELYRLLVKPAEEQIAPARRVLISGSGPLHTLPFAALIRKDRFLVEWKPAHSVLSATVYAELKKARPPAGPPQSQVVAFGDPAYPRLPKEDDATPEATLELLTAVRRGLSLDPLPATRREVEAIAGHFPGARVYLGSEATEERAKEVGSQARLLHFACHGLLDERFPLNSALALTVPERPEEGRDNGLLQAWEIFEGIRLDADLVTLSACDSARGKEMGGEGLLGLTRAFQYAGARSVLASLWGVSDDSTADLMKRFYGHLSAGRSKDEALQAAQVELIRSRGFAHPYHWAAFQLTGDWR